MFKLTMVTAGLLGLFPLSSLFPCRAEGGLAQPQVPGMSPLMTSTPTSADDLYPAHSLNVAGVRRTYYVFVPPSYNPHTKTALVLLLHGRGGTATATMGYTGFVRKASANGFILCAPQALGDPATWSVGFNTGMEDDSDVRFIKALIDHEKDSYAIDPDRVFVAGHSSGAMMAYRLASEISGRIAAIGVMAGTIGAHHKDGGLTEISAPRRPVSVVAFHGTLDPLMPYAPGDTWAYNSNFVPATESVAFWARVDGCSTTPRRTVLANGVVLRDDYGEGTAGTAVVLYSIVQGDHWWPGDKSSADFVTPADQAISATDVMWDFFLHHPREAAPVSDESPGLVHKPRRTHPASPASHGPGK